MNDSLRSALASALGPHFTLGEELRGGMARIFVATDTSLARRVVVKTLGDAALDGSMAERFRREILVAAGLQHPNVVPLLSVGATADGVPFYVMPFVEGQTLRHRLARGAMLPPEVAGVLRDVLRGLAAAHRKGIIHRDIKPENIFLSDGVAMLSDFGIAKALDLAFSSRATATGVAVGTPAYMAPEQVAAESTVGARADLYALGVVTWELLAGRHPFEGRAGTAMLAAHLTEDIAPIESVVPGVPDALARVVNAMVAKDPAHRPTDAESVVAELSALITPTASAPLRASTASTANAANAANPANPANPANTARAPRRVWPSLLALLVVAAATALWWRATPAAPETTENNPWATFTWVWPVTEVRVATADTVAQSLLQDAVTKERGVRLVPLESPQAPDSVAMIARSVGRTVVLERLGQAPLTVLPLTLPREEVVDRIAGVLTLLSTDALGEWMLPKGLPPTYEEVQHLIGVQRDWTSRGTDATDHARFARALDDFTAALPRWPAAVLLMATRMQGEAWPGRLAVLESMTARRSELTTAESALLNAFDAQTRTDAARYLSALREFVATTHSRELGRAMSLAMIDARQLREAEQLVISTGPRPGTEHQLYWYVRTRLQHIQREYDAELASTELALQRSSGRVSARADRLRAHLARGGIDSVMAGVAELPGLPVDPQLSPGWAMKLLADESRLHGHADAAATLLARSVEWYRVHSRDDATGDLSLEYAQVLLATGDTASGTAVADSVARAHPNARTPLAVRALLAARRGDPRLADSLFGAWRALPPMSGDEEVRERWRTERGTSAGGALLFEARLAALRGDSGRAVAAVRRAFEFDGWRDYAMLLHADPDFASVRDLPEVRALLGVR